MMDWVHIEFLVEDRSGGILLRKVMEKYIEQKALLKDSLSYNIFNYCGIGHLPKNLTSNKGPKTTMLLNELPKRLRAFDKSLKTADDGYRKAIIVVLDNDRNECSDLKASLIKVIEDNNITVETHFCIAIEEMEAWLLGDAQAVLQAYPKAREKMIHEYKPDSIIGTWEYLANTIYPGKLTKTRKPNSGYEIRGQKCEWAEKIGECLDIRNNNSPSFNYLLKKLDQVCGL